eukprot:5218249-Prymnesium_polylepis.1
MRVALGGDGAERRFVSPMQLLLPISGATSAGHCLRVVENRAADVASPHCGPFRLGSPSVTSSN